MRDRKNSNRPEPKLESTIQKRIMLAIGAIRGIRLFRVNTGQAWQGTLVSYENEVLVLRNPRRIHVGLTKGGSDLIGWKSFVVEQKHVGMRLAQFVALECKTKDGTPTDEQENFVRVVKDAGGISAIVRSEEDAKAAAE